jgi:hypothetical protein
MIYVGVLLSAFAPLRETLSFTTNRLTLETLEAQSKSAKQSFERD